VSDRRLLLGGGLLAGAAVALGAFGAHALRTLFDAERLGWWQTGVDYQMWHALALIALAAVPGRRFRVAGAFLGSGSLLFSASLYLMALTGWRWLGMVTPLGGLAMLAGWILVVRSAFSIPRD
jgi:uncharacterized membrane protein YgdD (TMEM256/DUF423 family)